MESKDRAVIFKRGAHTGCAAIVIGGGASAPSDFAVAIATFPDAIQISANHHGFLLSGAHPDFAVHVDEHQSKTGLRFDDFLATHYGCKVTVSRFGFATHRLPALAQHGIDSGLSACYIAHVLGCAPVVPCGFDRWTASRDDGQYFHDEHTDQRVHCRTAVLARDSLHVPNLAGLKALRPVSGPWLKFFPPLGVQAYASIPEVEFDDPKAYHLRPRIVTRRPFRR